MTLLYCNLCCEIDQNLLILHVRRRIKRTKKRVGTKDGEQELDSESEDEGDGDGDDMEDDDGVVEVCPSGCDQVIQASARW